MWNIILTEGARKSLDSYFASYQKYFLDRFTDTGIWSEEVIRKGYESDSEELLDLALSTLEKAFQQEIIPYALSEARQSRYTLLRMEARYLAVTYEEDLSIHTRTIHELRIWRKR